MKASRPKNSPIFSGLLLTLLALVASGCVLPGPRMADSSQPRDLVFLPPTLAPTPFPTSPAPTVSATSDQLANCVDQLAFVADQTVPDGTLFAPGSSIDKRWEVENSGTCNWNSKYHLKLVAGPEMGAKPEALLPPVRSGNRGVIRLLFRAPSQPAAYRSAWQAYNQDGQPFGDTVYIDIIVKQNAPTPTP